MGNKENKMFCFQCQETAGCSGCTVSGVCGKKPDVAAMQDLLVYVTKGLSAVTTELRFDGKEIEAYVNEMIIVNLLRRSPMRILIKILSLNELKIHWRQKKN